MAIIVYLSPTSLKISYILKFHQAQSDRNVSPLSGPWAPDKLTYAYNRVFYE